MKIIYTLLFSTMSIAAVLAQADTINSSNNKLQTQQLKESNTTYLVYMADSLGNRTTTGDIWEREIRFKKLNGLPVVEFNWKWYQKDSLFANVRNLCDRKTLTPIFHKGYYPSRKLTLAYDFKSDKMVASDSVANNIATKRPPLSLPIPVISWEQDLETYPLLPIKKVGQRFEIAFFDPNEKAPAYHLYEVVGKEKLKLNDDTTLNCWLLRINYSDRNYATFWLTEKSKEVVKMKEHFNGKYRYKVRLY